MLKPPKYAKFTSKPGARTGVTNSRSSVKISSTVSITQANHTLLVDYLLKKLTDQKETHDAQVAKFCAIDKKVYGYLVPNDDDEKRLRDNASGFGVKPVANVLPLVFTQLDDSVTYFIEVFSNNNDLYSARAPVEQQDVAKAFSSLMNDHSLRFSHVREVNKFLFNALKYNQGPLGVEWEVIYGNKVENNEAGSGVEVKTKQVYMGNKLTAFDPYNFMYDDNVAPCDLATKGEFFAVVEELSAHQIRLLDAAEKLFNVPKETTISPMGTRWFTEKPTVRYRTEGNKGTATKTQPDFDSILSQGHRKGILATKKVERIKFKIWLPLKAFGLSTSPELKICAIELLNNTNIVYFEQLDNAHGMLPISVASPIEDGFAEHTHSYAEILTPFQDFASAQMNIHQDASRRALYGLTFYNSSVIDLEENFDPVAGAYAFTGGPEVRIRDHIHQIFDGPGTERTLTDIDFINTLMQQVLPTDMLKQVTSLDRATKYQAAATVQGSNRRNLKIAKVMDSQAMAPMKQMQMYNILQYQETLSILGPENQPIEITPSTFRDTQLEFTIADGLQGLDKLSMVDSMKEMLVTVIQNPQAASQIDVVKVIDYWMTLLGDKTDFSSFKITSQMDKLSPELKEQAFQLLQAAIQQQQTGQPAQVPGTPDA